MRPIRMGAFVALLIVTVMIASCGDTFRPIVTPIVPASGDPNAANTVIVVSTAFQLTQGMATHVNLAGDSISAVVQLGYDPKAAVTLSQTFRTTVSNAGSSTGSGTVSEYIASLPTFLGATSVSLPVNPTREIPGKIFANSTLFTYIFLSPGANGANTVGVIDTASGSLSNEINLCNGCTPSAMSGTPNSGFVYVSDSSQGQVYVIDQSDNSLSGIPINLGTNADRGTPANIKPVDMAMSTDGNFLYVLNQGTNDLTIINTLTNLPVTTLPVGVNPVKMFIDSKLLRLYVINVEDTNPTPSVPGSITVFDIDPTSATRNTALTGNVSSGGGLDPHALTVTPDGSKVYVVNRVSMDVSVFDTVSLQFLPSRITIGTKDAGSTPGTHLIPIDIAVSSDNNRVAVAVVDPDYAPSLNPVPFSHPTATYTPYVDGGVQPFNRPDMNGVWTIDTSTNKVVVKLQTPFVTPAAQTSPCLTNTISVTDPAHPTNPPTTMACTHMRPIALLQ